jgi:hypothetical protein
VSAVGWTSAPTPDLDPAWEAARDRLDAAHFYWQCMHRWGAGPTPQQARWIPMVERIIKHRETALAQLRPILGERR